MPYTPSQIRKVIVAVVGFLATVLTSALAVGPEVVPEGALPYIHIFLAIATSYGVFRVKNEDPPGEVNVDLSTAVNDETPIYGGVNFNAGGMSPTFGSRTAGDDGSMTMQGVPSYALAGPFLALGALALLL